MAIKVVSWNIEGRLTRFAKKGRGSPEHIVETIRALDGDVVFLAEASDDDVIDSKINERLDRLGYDIHTVRYDDDSNEDRKWAAEEVPNMKLLTRIPAANFRQIRLGDIRNALVVEVINPTTGQLLRIFGVHLDDKNEANRLRQVKDLVMHVKESSAPTIVMGDYNAMHATDFRAQYLRSSLIILAIKYWPHARTRDIFERLSGMAIGEALETLQNSSGLKDVDVLRRATTTPKLRFQEWMPSIRLVQIDHMFVSHGMTVTGFSVGTDGGSDHRPISATIEV